MRVVGDLPVCVCSAVRMCGVLVGGVVWLCAVVFVWVHFVFTAVVLEKWKVGM